MAFDVQDILTPSAIGRIDHFLDDLDGTAGNRALQFNLEVLDQFGDVMKMRSGDEAPHLTSQQINQLQSFMDSRRANLPSDLDWAEGHQCGRCTWRFRDGDGTADSRSLHARVIELDGSNAKAYYARGIEYYKMKDMEKAKADITRARQLGFNAR